MEANLDPLVAAILDRVRETGPAWMLENAFLWEEIEEFARISVRTQLGGLRHGVLPESCPAVDAAAAQGAAKVGELKALLNGYRICQMTLWEALARPRRSAPTPTTSAATTSCATAPSTSSATPA